MSKYLRINGIEYEAFTTSGGLGTMAETYEGQVDVLNYKTIRYPGHLDGMRLLINELRFKERPQQLVQCLANALPPDDQGSRTDTCLGTGAYWRSAAISRVCGRLPSDRGQRSYAYRNHLDNCRVDCCRCGTRQPGAPTTVRICEARDDRFAFFFANDNGKALCITHDEKLHALPDLQMQI